MTDQESVLPNKDKMSDRASRKEEGKRLKRQKIEEAGGKRPRRPFEEVKKSKTKRKRKGAESTSVVKTTHFGRGGETKSRVVGSGMGAGTSTHRFGRVMEAVPCPNRPRKSTVSIAVPGSVVSNCQTSELRTLVAGQIARAAAIYHVDEIVVYDDRLSSTGTKHKKFDPHVFLARLLQYCECPQYLRRRLFPVHSDLRHAGILPPLDAPHHARSDDRCRYREGVVVAPKATKSKPPTTAAAAEDDDDNNKNNNNDDKEKDDVDTDIDTHSNRVDVGVRSGTFVTIDRVLTVGVRCTVRMDSYAERRGTVVSPRAPTEENGTYWGYNTRLAGSLREALEGDDGSGYDWTIGTSERGHVSVDDDDFDITAGCKSKENDGALYRRCLIVFGGVAGIEECVDADESMKVSGKDSHKLFNVWVNTCPLQGSRTIRTEEAILITLARLRPLLLKQPEPPSNTDTQSTRTGKDKNDPAHDVPHKDKNDNDSKDVVEMEFSDQSISDESSQGKSN